MNENVQRYFNSKGHKKLRLYFEDIVKKESFQKKIKELRKIHGIPLKGFKESKKWLGDSDLKRDLKNSLELLCEEFGLYYPEWWVAFEEYLFFNDTERALNANINDLCLINESDEENLDDRREDVLKENQHFPVIIKISPYASQRDIVDYIRTMYPFIEHFQEKYKSRDIKIGKQRKRNPDIQERDNFIYKNRHKPRKEIGKLLKDKYNNYLDQGEIGKIISREIKSRG